MIIQAAVGVHGRPTILALQAVDFQDEKLLNAMLSMLLPVDTTSTLLLVRESVENGGELSWQRSD